MRTHSHRQAPARRAFAEGRALVFSQFPAMVRGARHRRHEGAPLTVFVHGYLASSGVLGPMGHALHEAGVAPHQIHFGYPPVGSVDAIARRLGKHIAAAGHAPSVRIVAHSLGGIVARWYAHVLGGRVDRIVCIASPHGGTQSARAGSFIPLAREMVPGHDTLERLAAAHRADRHTEVHCVVGSDDDAIVPRESAWLDDETGVVIPGATHSSILYDPRTWQVVAQWLGPAVLHPG